MEELQPLLDQLKEADAAGDTTKASALAAQISTIQSGASSAVAPADTNAALPNPEAAPAAPPVDPVLQGALSSLKEADTTAATDPLEQMRAAEIAKRIQAGSPAALKKADLTNDPDLPEFTYTPHDVVNPNKFRYNYKGGVSTPGPNIVKSTLKEEDLFNDPQWMASNRILYKMNKGYEFEGSNEELHNYGLWVASALNNNFTAMGTYFASYKDKDPKAIRALLYNMDAAGATTTNWSNTGRALAEQGLDVTNYIGGLGAKLVAGDAIKVASKVALKRMLKRTLAVSLVEGDIMFGAFGANDAAKQSLEVKAGQRETMDPMQTLGAAVTGFGFGAGLSVLGGLIGGALTPEVRQVAKDWLSGKEVMIAMDGGTSKKASEMTQADWIAYAKENGVDLPDNTPVAPTEAPVDPLANQATGVAPPPTNAASEPPVAPDMVRVYHGGNDATSGGGRWISSDKNYAANYGGDISGKELWYVDIPKDDPRLADHAEQGTTALFETTPEEAARMQRIGGEAPKAPDAAPEGNLNDWTDRTDIGDSPMGEGWVTKTDIGETGTAPGWKTRIIDANGNEVPEHISKDGWTEKAVLDDGSEIDVPSWEKMMLENEAERDAARKTEVPFEEQGPTERAATLAEDTTRKERMSNGSAKDATEGISEITAIVKAENFDNIPHSHAEASRFVSKIIDPIAEVFRRGSDDEIGDVLTDPVTSNDLAIIKDAVQEVDSKVRAGMDKAEAALATLEARIKNEKVVTPDHLAELDAAHREADKWTALVARTGDVNKRLGSYAGLLLNHSKIMIDGIGPEARRINVNDLKAKGFTNREIRQMHQEAVTFSSADLAAKSKQYRKLRRQFFQALAEGNAQEMENLANALTREAARVTERKLKTNGDGFFHSLSRGIVEWYTNSLLANFKSLEINHITAFFEYGLRPVFGAVGGALSKDTYRRALMVRSITADTRRESLDFAKKAWAEDFNAKGSRYTESNLHALPGTFGKVVRVPMRAMAFGDTYISAQAYKNEVAATAADAFVNRHNERVAELKALIAKADPKAKATLEKRLAKAVDGYDQRYKDYVRKAVSEAIDSKGNRINASALKTSEEVLFKKEFGKDSVLERILGGGEQLLNAHPLSRVLVPFYRTPIRVAEAYIKYVPGVNVLVHKGFRNDLFGRNGLYARDVARGKLVWGTTAMLIAWEASSAGYMTGGGPMDPKMKKSLMDTGWRPYRWYIPYTGMDINNRDTWLDYSRLQPIASPLMLMSNINERYRLYDDQVGSKEITAEDVNYTGHMVAASGIAFAQSIKDMSMLTGVSGVWDLMNTAIKEGITDNTINDAGTAALKLLQGFIPATIRKTGDIVDDSSLDPQTWKDVIQASIPGMKGAVNHSYTVLGRMRSIASPAEGLFWIPRGIGKGVPESKERYIYEQIAVMEAVTKGSLAMPTTNPDYPGLDLRTARTVDGTMSLHDKVNRIMANLKIGDETMESSLYSLLKSTENTTLMTPGNAQFNSVRTTAVRAELKRWRDIAWQKGMKEEERNNSALLDNRAKQDRLKQQAEVPYLHQIQNLFTGYTKQ